MGRHREFDVVQALDAALSVFWRKGFEGASYADLVEATGVERPALYSAFGNKEDLFRRALARYDELYMTHIPEGLQLPTAREVVAHILHSSVNINTRFPDRTGCLGIHGALAGSNDSEPVQQALIKFRAAGEQKLRERLERARAEGDLPDTAQPKVLSRYVMAVLHGMAVQAKAGFSPDELHAIVEQALSNWPVGRAPRSARSSKRASRRAPLKRRPARSRPAAVGPLERN